MSERKPSDIARSMLEKEREQVRLTESLLVELELMEMDSTFFGEGGVSVVEVSLSQVTFKNSSDDTRAYPIGIVPTSLLEQYRGDRYRQSGEKRMPYKLVAVTSELIKRKRAAK